MIELPATDPPIKLSQHNILPLQLCTWLWMNAGHLYWDLSANLERVPPLSIVKGKVFQTISIEFQISMIPLQRHPRNYFSMISPNICHPNAPTYNHKNRTIDSFSDINGNESVARFDLKPVNLTTIIFWFEIICDWYYFSICVCLRALTIISYLSPAEHWELSNSSAGQSLTTIQLHCNRNITFTFTSITNAHVWIEMLRENKKLFRFSEFCCLFYWRCSGQLLLDLHYTDIHVDPWFAMFSHWYWSDIHCHWLIH